MSPYSRQRRTSGEVQIVVFQYVAALVGLWLLAGFWQLQVQSPEVYEQRAERNRIKSRPLHAPRGKILDREGRILVDSRPNFKVLMSGAEARPQHLALIAEGLNISRERLEVQLRRLRESDAPGYRAVILKENLTPGHVAFVEAHKAEFQELELLRSQNRLYPTDGLASHLIGYVGEINDRELEQVEFVLAEPGAEVGKAGVERQYNNALTGSDGSRVVVVDSRGRERGFLGSDPARPGSDVHLTIDLDLQVVAELAMRGRKGAVVALDPRNGEILALVSSPNYFPDKFVGGISVHDWRRLTGNPDKPLLNRAIQAQLAPGSVFKPVVAVAALESGVIDTDFTVQCQGGASFYGHYFRCHKRDGHGEVNLYQALVHSCDVFFYTVGNKLGINRIAEFAERVGFGRPTGIDLPHEEEGIVPSPGWKLRHFREKWYAGETISVTIGQGALTVTPLQVAYAIGGLASGGVWYQPRLVSTAHRKAVRDDYEPPAPRIVRLHKKSIEAVVKGLWGVVNAGGTGGRARLAGYNVCGKTGTAQLVSNRSPVSGDRDLRDNAWFVGFAPCRSPEIVAVALFEHGEHGHLAAPIVRDVLKAYFDKQRRAPGDVQQAYRGAGSRVDLAASRSGRENLP